MDLSVQFIFVQICLLKRIKVQFLESVGRFTSPAALKFFAALASPDAWNLE